MATFGSAVGSCSLTWFCGSLFALLPQMAELRELRRMTRLRIEALQDVATLVGSTG
jgi:hypothetical protein